MKWMTLFTFGVVFAGHALANTTPAAQDVQAVQQQLQQAQRQLNQQQQQQQGLAKGIAKTQTQLQAATEQLTQLTQKQQQSAQQLAQLQLQLSQLQTQSQHNKAQAQRLLASQYKNKQPEALVLMLQNSNPNDKGRQMVYLRYLHQANGEVLRDLKQQVVLIDAQQQKIAAEHAKLQQLQQQSTQAQQRLQHQHRRQAHAHTALQQDIATQQQHIQKLKQDEQQLQALLTRLNRQQVAKSRVKAKPKPAVLAPKTVQTKPKIPSTVTTPTLPNHQLTAEDMALDAPTLMPVVHDTAPSTSQRFSQLQGRMSLPAAGVITGRFGSSRGTGGTWKGIFIQNQGASVHSVAAGEVVYAAHLAGYGSTVIVDHDGGYMTVYAGLASTSVSTGQQLGARSRLGASGQLPTGEQGTYFEVRYQTRAMNPLSWVG